MQGHRSPDGASQTADARDRSQFEELEQAPMQEICPFEFIARRPVVRMDDDRARRVHEPMAGEQHFARPLEILGDRRRLKGVLVPDGSPDA